MAQSLFLPQESGFRRVLRDGRADGCTVMEAETPALLGGKSVFTYADARRALRFPEDERTDVPVFTCYSRPQLEMVKGRVVLIPVGWSPFTIYKARPDLFSADHGADAYMHRTATEDRFAGYRLTDWIPWQRQGVRTIAEEVGLQTDAVSSLRTYLVYLLFFFERMNALPLRPMKVRDQLPNGNHLAVRSLQGKIHIFEVPPGAELRHALSYIPRPRWWFWGVSP